MQAELSVDRPASDLNPRYTFQSFVVGSSNQFAQAAAWNIATRVTPRYNPLYIYGGEGLGKTHLMQAIAHEIKRNRPEIKVLYTSTKQFMGQMVHSLRRGEMPLLRGTLRSADALLFDDIQLLGATERTQEEFFHTFNALHQSGRQIVISGDRPPKDIFGLADRLRSRLEWGLVADIEPPDLETRMAILDRAAEEDGTSLPEDVRACLAARITSNVRDLRQVLISYLKALHLANGSAASLPLEIPPERGTVSRLHLEEPQVKALGRLLLGQLHNATQENRRLMLDHERLRREFEVSLQATVSSAAVLSLAMKHSGRLPARTEIRSASNQV